jgi:signal transduction histidine kinase
MDNMLDNAVKYTPEGGAVEVRAYTEDTRFHFVVQDTGVGIPIGDIPFVFESFYRGNQAGNKPIKGAGLGLSLVRNVIEQHGGRVWVESEEGKGSTFGFWIPII